MNRNVKDLLKESRSASPLVPLPSNAFIPERDLKTSPVLEAVHLGVSFGGLNAVDDFSLVIGRTEIAGLIGPNGAGKTTVFNLLTNVYQPTRGNIMLNGYSTAGKSTAQETAWALRVPSRISDCSAICRCLTM